MNTELAALQDSDGGHYWGLSPESILLYNNAQRTDSEDAWAALRRQYDLTVYITNRQVEWDQYCAALDAVVEAWMSPPVTTVAQHATATTARQFVLGCAYTSTGGVMRLLRSAQEQLSETEDDPLVSRADARGIADDGDIALLRTFDVIQSRQHGYQFDRKLLTSLRGSQELSPAEARYAVVARICEAHDIEEIHTVVPEILGGFDLEPPERPPASVSGSLPVFIENTAIQEFVVDLFSGDAEEVFTSIASAASARSQRLDRTMGLGVHQSPSATPDWPLPTKAATVCATASRHDRPVATGWVLEQVDIEDRYKLRRRLADAGLSVSLEDDLLWFGTSYGGPAEDDALKTYEDWVTKERTQANTTAAAAHWLANQATDWWDAQRAGLLRQTVEQLSTLTVAPTRFVFTMFDPVHHADKYEIDEYVGESPHLNDEVDQIREWRESQSADAVTFAEQVREICAYPLEHNEVAPRLRIMSPWLNFTLQEYTALFQRLLENDITVQLLFRLPSRSEWTNMKQNFLTRLGETHGNLELRTYTRYKKYKSHAQLRRISNDEADDEGDRYVSETGIHAKLFIAGDPAEGAVLAGSANLMENSFYYNPEAGLHTRHPEVIDTATKYYDLIWDLAEPDRIPPSVFTGKTNFEYYPKVYRR